MTQEQRNLLMKDLSSRLLYGVKVQVDQQGLQEYDNYWTVWDFDKEAQEVSGIHMYGVTLDCMAMVDGVIPFEFIKPYLFPMSSMTREQLKEMQEIIGNPNDACVSVNSAGLELWLNSVDTDPTIWLDVLFELQDWLNKNHFDYRELIPRGAAKDATGLNIY